MSFAIHPAELSFGGMSIINWKIAFVDLDEGTNLQVQ
jgi:hypothetical protein